MRVLPPACLLVLVLIGAAGCGGARWQFDYNNALRQAEQQNRPVLLYFRDWLSIDRNRFEAQAFNDPAAVAELRRTINVWLEQGLFPELVRRHEIETIPTFVLLAPSGQERARLSGVPTTETFTRWLRDSLNGRAATPPVATQPAEPAPPVVAPADG